jgi:competence protein ComEC
MGRIAAFALLAVVLVLSAPVAPPRAAALVALASLLAALRAPRWRSAALVATLAALALLRLDAALAARVPPALVGVPLEAGVRVVSLPVVDPHRRRFEVEVEDGPLAGRRLLVHWYDADASPAAGERWRLTLRARRPRGALNPGALDLERVRLVAGIDGTALVEGGARLAAAEPGVLALRAALAARIGRGCGARPEGCAIVAGLAVGHGAGLAPTTWRALRRTGTVHLVAISGLHVTLLGLLAAWSMARAVRRIPRLVARVPASVVGGWCGLAVAAAYAQLAGGGVPAERTVLMLAVLVAARSLRRPPGGASVVGSALLAVLVVDPLAVLAPGFWLSFGGVVVIGFAASAPDALRRLLAEQGAITVGLAPLLVVAFGRLPLAAPLANLIAVPFFNLLLLPTILASCVLAGVAPRIADQGFAFAAEMLERALPVLDGLGSWLPELAPAAAPAALAAAALGSLLLLAPRGVPGRWLGLVLWAPALVPAAPSLAPGEVELVVLDVGHGLAALVRTRSHLLVYDAGPAGPGSDAGRWAVVPAIDASGLRPDAVVISHGDRDHAGGAATLASEYPAARWWVGEGAVPGAACQRGVAWRWDGVGFRFLGPPPGGEVEGNDGSCVLQVSAAGGAILLPGDVEASGEEALLASGAPLAARVLVAPHHGSASSSSAAFVAAVGPSLVVHPAAHAGRWRFPRPEVVARYQALGARQLVTGRSGAVRVRLHADGTMAVAAAREVRRAWREP